MLIRRASPIRSSEITAERIYANRREMVRSLTAAGALGAAGAAFGAEIPVDAGARLPGIEKSEWSTDATPNTYEEVTTYNNFYEFGTGKGDPVRYSRDFKPRPWSIAVTGEADVTGTFDLEDFVKPHTLEERIYRFRCVEAWSMIVPWVGIPLADVVRRVQAPLQCEVCALQDLARPGAYAGAAFARAAVALRRRAYDC